jgi:Asp-tRNA(Asn)/Glu-tRNA(Gln) amidotransferase A subunit family amidase
MADHSPIFWPVARLIEAYKARELSPVEVTEDALARIAALDAQLHSYLSVTPEIALDQARDAERSYRDADGPRAPLLGVPVSIKDLFDVRGAFTTLGSRFYGGEPAEIDSAPVALLRSAGSVFLGKTNTAEFGQSATTDNLLGRGLRAGRAVAPQRALAPASQAWPSVRTAVAPSGFRQRCADSSGSSRHSRRYLRRSHFAE